MYSHCALRLPSFYCIALYMLFTLVLQFLSFAPAMGHWIVDYKVSVSYVHHVLIVFSILLHLTAASDVGQTQCTMC